ncbi:MAG: putative protein D14 [Prokaryotic dsDNA virus sp.]|nr:MAG: putative protein D14 [Prokaryotic dsDNA virus sp.]|tara:strand:- start:11407 stop:11763 length:357 start_codon:yes stop_codon:yes gene_type:complete
MVNSRQKGARGERELASVLREEGWTGAMRGQQRSGCEQADVVGGPAGVHWEVKRVERLLLAKAVEQARRDARPGEVPIVAHRRSQEPWLATLDLKVLLRLLAWAEAAGVDLALVEAQP